MKKVLIGLVSLFALIIVGLVVTISMVNLNKYKPQIVKAVKDNSGYEMKINGDISASFSPVGISISNVVIKNPQIKANQKFFDMKKLSVAVELMPLLSKKVKVKYIILDGLNLDITKLKNGKFNFEVVSKKTKTKQIKQSQKSSSNKKTELPKIDINKVRIQNANINFEDLKSKTVAKIKAINIAVDNIGFDPSKKMLQAISFDAKTKINSIVFDKYKIKDIKIDVNMKNAIVNMSDMKLSMYDSLVDATARLNLNKKIPFLNIEADIPKFKLENFSKEYLKKDILSGVVKVHKKFSLSLGDIKTIKKTLKGTALIDGVGVGVKGFDLDSILAKYNNTKKRNPADLGMSLASGFAKGGNLSGVFGANSGGTTLLKRVHIKIDIAKGIATLSDVAIATGKNRIALKGKLNILKDRFLDMKFGVLDAKNCAKFSQTIEGTFAKPKVKVDATSIKSTVNMVSNLLESFGVKTPKILKKKQGKCKVFYNGMVKQPK
ncbi:MAG: AsmA family protein [Epsilonproteobacteria bacterium]|nr:AsmA family protein [Campylobacterota bacterium]